MKAQRPRTLRRQQERLQARELVAVKRRLADRGVYEKCARVNAIVAPGEAVFWKAYKDRVAARELLTPITKAVEARDIATKVLGELGVDLEGVALRATWRPPQMFFDAVPAYEVAMEAVTEVRESIQGKARAEKLAGLRSA